MLWVANWKMNGNTEFIGQYMARLIQRLEKQKVSHGIVICPPLPYLSLTAHYCAGTAVEVGAQNCAPWENGAFTGEVSAEMLHDVGCRYVILGHSERRQKFMENEEQLKHKIEQAWKNNLKIIYCVGETIAEKADGKTQAVLERQMKPIVNFPHSKLGKSLIIAYEPVWAIGSGVYASDQDIRIAKNTIQEILGSSHYAQFLYGGSVSSKNLQEIQKAQCDGFLVGGASLRFQEFWEMITSLA